MFRGLLLAFFFNDRFSNVKLDGNIRICVPRRRTDRTGANFVKLGVNFRGDGCTFYYRRSVTTLFEMCFADCC